MKRIQKFFREYLHELIDLANRNYTSMALLKYFKHKAETSACKNLPDDNGSLCREVPASTREANLEVLATTGKRKGKCSSYLKVPGKQKSLIAKYAAEK